MTFGKRSGRTCKGPNERHTMSSPKPAADLAATNAKRHPGESADYRKARQALLVEEIELRRTKERIAQQRRDLPAGGLVPTDYTFVAESGEEVTLSELFGTHEDLAIYSYMFGPNRDTPCPMCTSWMSGFDHKIADIGRRIGFACIARAPIDRLAAAKKARGWTDLPVYSDPSGEFGRAYVSAEDVDTAAFNVFTRRDGSIRHHWSEEIGIDMNDPGQDARGAIEIDPLWLLLDTVPSGRGTDWYPSLTYR